MTGKEIANVLAAMFCGLLGVVLLAQDWWWVGAPLALTCGAYVSYTLYEEQKAEQLDDQQE